MGKKDKSKAQIIDDLDYVMQLIHRDIVMKPIECTCFDPHKRTCPRCGRDTHLWTNTGFVNRFCGWCGQHIGEEKANE